MNLSEIPTIDPKMNAILDWLRTGNPTWEFRFNGPDLEQRYIGTNTNALNLWKNWNLTGYSFAWWLNAYENRAR